MLKKDKEVKWTFEARNSFELIKKDIIEAPLLVSPEYSNPFLIFSFTSQDTISDVLLQKYAENKESAIAFFSKALRDV